MAEHHCDKGQDIDQIKGKIEEIGQNLHSGDLRFQRIDDKLDQILEQTTKTNGRVTDLEKASTGFLTRLSAIDVILKVQWSLISAGILGLIGRSLWLVLK